MTLTVLGPVEDYDDLNLTSVVCRVDAGERSFLFTGDMEKKAEQALLDSLAQLRPGTYALMDASQGHAIGTLDRCAATVLATVISKPTDTRTILDVGAKGLTMQSRTEGICAVPGKGTLYDCPEVHIEKVFDEHAIILDRAFHDRVQIGQKVRVIPVHICPVCNLYDQAYLISGDDVVQTLPIAGRGKLQ